MTELFQNSRWAKTACSIMAFALSGHIFAGCRGSTENENLSSRSGTGSPDDKFGQTTQGPIAEDALKLSQALGLVKFGDSSDVIAVRKYFHLPLKVTEESLKLSLKLTNPNSSATDELGDPLNLDFSARIADTSADKLDYYQQDYMATPDLMLKFLKGGLPTSPIQATDMQNYDPKAPRSKLIGILEFRLSARLPSEENATTLDEPEAINLTMKEKYPINSFAGCYMTWVVGLAIQNRSPTIVFSTTETEPLGGDFKSEVRMGGNVSSLKEWLALAKYHLSRSACNYGKVNEPLISKHVNLLWGGLKSGQTGASKAKIYGLTPAVNGPVSLHNLGALESDGNFHRPTAINSGEDLGKPRSLGKIGKVFAENIGALL